MERGYGVALAKDGSIYLTGSIDKNANGQTDLGGSDAFLAVYDAKGTHQYTHLPGTSSNDHGNGIVADAKGYIYIVGTTRQAAIVSNKVLGILGASSAQETCE